MAELKNTTSISSAISSLIRGDYDTPIIVHKDDKNKHILHELESLRIAIKSSKQNLENEINQQKVEISSVAHDLKTPLAIISGYAECLQDGIDDKDYLSLLSQKIIEMNKQVISLVEGTRKDIEKTKATSFESIIVSDFFLKETNKYKDLATSKNIQYAVGNIPSVKIFANKESLSKVLQNLVSNAIKFTPASQKVRVKFKKIIHYLKIIVKDNGIGIPQKDLPFIFDRFYTVDKARTDSSSSGLGLHIVKQTLEELGGFVTVKSELGKGSTFSIFIPLDERDKYIKIRSEKIDQMRKSNKMLLWVFLGWFMTPYYRFLKYFENRNKLSLVGAILTILLYPIVWFLDTIEIIVSNRITYFIY